MEPELKNKIFIAALFTLGILPYELNGFYNPLVVDIPWAFWTLEIASYVLLPLGVYGTLGKPLADPLRFH